MNSRAAKANGSGCTLRHAALSAPESVNPSRSTRIATETATHSAMRSACRRRCFVSLSCIGLSGAAPEVRPVNVGDALGAEQRHGAVDVGPVDVEHAGDAG